MPVGINPVPTFSGRLTQAFSTKEMSHPDYSEWLIFLNHNYDVVFFRC